LTDCPEEQVVSWFGKLEQARSKALARRADPWRLRLERIRGKVCDDGIERISTQAVFDVLEVLQGNRGAGACRRLATLIRDLGWTAIKARGLNQAGFRDMIRGYAREPKRSPLS
jgi:hypothetical protein